MKNYILLFFLWLVYSSATSQNTIFSIGKYEKSIIDTVSYLSTSKYYLTTNLDPNIPHYSVVKKVSDSTLIIKSHTTLDLDFGKKLYLLDDNWKYSNRISQKTADPLEQSIFSIKVSKLSCMIFIIL